MSTTFAIGPQVMHTCAYSSLGIKNCILTWV